MKFYCGTKQKLAFLGLAIFLFITAPISTAFSQCDFDWKPGQSLPGVTEYIYAATVWDPDGKGPLKPLLVLGGGFSGDSNNIIAWNGDSFQPLGTGVGDPYDNVLALTVYNGQLIAAGNFTKAGGVDVNRVARWDGSSWQPLGSGTDSTVNALTVYNGQLIAGGSFFMAGGMSVDSIAAWNGTDWHSLGDGPGGNPYALTVYNGRLIAGGSIFYYGSRFISQWDGNNWLGIGTGVSNGVNALAVYNGQLIAGSDNLVASWDGSGWRSLGTGMNDNGIIRALTIYGGYLVAGGWFTSADGKDANCIAAWDNSSWQPLGSGMSGGGQNGPCVYALTTYNGEIIAAGDFTTAGGKNAPFWAKWGLAKPIAGDLNYDCVVNESDLDWLAERWLDNDCLYNGWCYEADLNYDTQVDFLDYAVLANHWLEEFIAGDFNGNNREDFTDYAILSSAWNTEQGQPNWNPACDISDPKDNIIDLKDLSVFASDWLLGVE